MSHTLQKEVLSQPTGKKPELAEGKGNMGWVVEVGSRTNQPQPHDQLQK